jgi:PST family polysaccharide transporter
MTEHKTFHRAVKWAYVMNWGGQGFAALFTFILASLLGPRDFGTVSMAMIYIAFIQMLLNQGLYAAIIQRPDLQPEHLDSVFWLGQASSLILVGLSVGLSGWWAGLNHLPQLARVISVLSLTIPIEGLAMVQRAVLQREMDFKSLAIRSAGSVVAGGVMGLAMAFKGCGVWALVGQRVTEDATALALLWTVGRWRPRWRFSLDRMRELFGFSTASFAGKLGTFVNQQSSALLIGLYFGPLVVGLYRLAERMMGLVLDVATSSLQLVSFSEFSRLQDKPSELRRSVLACLRLSSIVTLPAMAGLAAVSGVFMGALGSNWIPAADALKILCVLGMALAFASFTGPLLSALSKPQVVAMVVWGFNAVNVIALVGVSMLLAHASAKGQVVGIAATRFAMGALLFAPTLLYILMQHSRISLGDLWKTARPSILAALAVAAVLLPFSRLTPGCKSVVLLVVEVTLGGLTGMAVLLTLDDKLRNAALAPILAAMRTRGRVGTDGRLRELRDPVGD